jgi:hypothetical protein
MERRTEDGKTKGRPVKLISIDREGRNLKVVEHKWSGSFQPIKGFHQFTDVLEALCWLPNREELSRILEVSTMSKLPAIWRRARLSPLEQKAIDIFSVLAFSSKRDRLRWLREFFEQEGWQFDLGGRPTLDSRNKAFVVLGLEIERIIERLKLGYLLNANEKKKGDYYSDEALIAKRLKGEGYDVQEINAIVKAHSPQDAAIRYFLAKKDVRFLSKSNKSIRNDYAMFKRLRKQFPSSF